MADFGSVRRARSGESRTRPLLLVVLARACIRPSTRAAVPITMEELVALIGS
jgi:hypothetical protein